MGWEGILGVFSLVSGKTLLGVTEEDGTYFFLWRGSDLMLRDVP